MGSEILSEPWNRLKWVYEHKEPRELSGKKIPREERVRHEKISTALVTEGKGMSAFSVVFMPQVISCNDRRANIWGRRMETPIIDCNTEQGDNLFSLRMKCKVWATAGLQGLRRIWRDWHERICTLWSLRESEWCLQGTAESAWCGKLPQK